MIGIKYVSFHEPSGYGVAAARYMRGLVAAGVPVTWTPMVPGRGWRLGYEPYRGAHLDVPVLGGLCNRDIPYDVVIVHLVPEYYSRWSMLESGKRVIGYSVWETDRLPRHWPALLNGLRGVMVPCRWNKEVFRSSGVTVDVEVVPHIADDPDRDGDGGADADWGIAEGDFAFYTINAWTNRKAVGLAVSAYLNAFDGDDPVVFVVKTSARDFTRRTSRLARMMGFRSHRETVRAISQLGRGVQNPPKLIVRTDLVSDAEMAALHRRGDAYVSLCRAEGWGVGAFDAAAWGNAIIMSGHGGHREYLDQTTSYLVDYDLVAVRDPPGVPSYTSDQRWAEPDVVHAGELMRRVFSRREEAAERGRRVQRVVRDTFGSERVTLRLLEAIQGMT